MERRERGRGRGRGRERESVCVWGWQADTGGFEHSLRCPGLSASAQVTSALGHGSDAGGGAAAPRLPPAPPRPAPPGVPVGGGAASGQHGCPECPGTGQGALLLPEWALRASSCPFPQRLGSLGTWPPPPPQPGPQGRSRPTRPGSTLSEQPEGPQRRAVPREGAEAQSPSHSDRLLSCLADCALSTAPPACPAALSCPELGDSLSRCHHERGVCHQRRLAPQAR